VQVWIKWVPVFRVSAGVVCITGRFIRESFIKEENSAHEPY